MSDPEALNDVRFLREVVARTHPSEVNHFWPVSVGWGCVVTFGYLLCGILAMNGRVDTLPFVWPVLIMLIGLPMQWYLVRRIRSGLAETGVRPRFRKDLLLCWVTISGMGLLWTAGMVISGQIAQHWEVLAFVWATLYVVGYVMNGILLSREWFWAAGVMLASLVAAFLAGPNYYWLPGVWIGGTFLLGGLLGGAMPDLELDEAVLSRPRLSILAALISGDQVDFTFLQKNLGIADGNLATHLRKLEAENYITAEKTLLNRKPKTWFRITPAGRGALERLFRQLEEMLKGSQPGPGTAGARSS